MSDEQIQQIEQTEQEKTAAERDELRAEVQRLHAEAADQCVGCERPTESVDCQCWACKLSDLEAERDDLRAKLAAAEANVARIINALDEDWADNAAFEGWGDVEGMVRTVQTLCRRYAEENDRADAAERQLAAVRALADKFERWPSGPSYAVTARAIREALSSEGGTE